MPARKLTYVQAQEIRERTSDTAAQLAAEFGVSIHTIRMVRTGRTYRRPPRVARPPQTTVEHFCPECGRREPDVAFGVDRSKPAGKTSWCLECKRTANTRWYAQNTQRKRAYQRAYARAIDAADWLTIAAAAPLTGYSATHLVWLCEQGVIPARQSSPAQKRHWLIRRDSIDEIHQRQRQRAWAAPGYLTVAEATAELGCSKQRVYQLIRAGKLPAQRTRRVWCIPTSAIEERMRSSGAGGTKGADIDTRGSLAGIRGRTDLRSPE